MGVSMRPEDPADVWDRLVASGKSPDEATAEVTKQFGPPPMPATRADLEQAGFRLDRLQGRPKFGNGIPGVAADATASVVGSRPTPAAPISGLLRSAASGASLGTSPYLIGAIRGAFSPTETVQEGISAEERALDTFRKEYPLDALSAEITSAMVVPVPWTKLGVLGNAARGADAVADVARASASASRFGRAARAVGARAAGRAAVEGAVQGAAETRGGLGPRVVGAGVGAVAGATTAGVFGAAGRAGGRLLGASPRLNRLASHTGLPILTPEERSAEMLVQAFADDAVTLEEAGRRVADANAAGKPFSVLDAGGRNVMGVGRGAVTRGGTAKDAIPAMLAERGAETEQRVISDLLQTTGGARQDAFATAEAIIQRREAEASPLFDAIRERFPADRPVKIEALDGLMGRPSMESAIDEAERIIRESGGELAQPFRLKTKDGKTVLRPLSFEEAQVLKQAHDDVADMAGARAPIESGGTGRTRQSKQKSTHAQLVDALDGTFDGYKEARDAFAGPSAILKAHNLGAEFHKLAPEKVRELTRDMSASEKSAFRAAALESFITNKVGSIDETHDFSRRLTSNSRKKAQIRELFDSDEHYEAFRDLLAQEARMHQTRGFLTQQSNTADKLMELTELFDIDVGTVAGAATGNPGSLLRLGSQAANKLGMTYSKNVANDVGRIATLTGDEAVQVFETLSAQAAEIARKRQAGATGRARTGRVLGGRLGGAVANQGAEP